MESALKLPTAPVGVNWDVTYACPLRCEHCYSESGRRPSLQLDEADMLKVADALVSLRPRTVQISGGEPLFAKGMLPAARRLRDGGIAVSIYTSGWMLDASMVGELAGLFSHIHISLDGATAEVHDRIRGRNGSFDKAMEALALLDAERRALAGSAGFRFGIDTSVLQSNFAQLAMLCSEIAPRFPAMDFLYMFAAAPTGLANRPSYVDQLLGEEQLAGMADGSLLASLRTIAPPSVRLLMGTGVALRMHPDDLASGKIGNNLMQVEPDGAVRGMPIYEGTVGNLLEEPADVLWQRAAARCHEPFVKAALAPVRTMRQWADAARQIDAHYASAVNRERIARRPVYVPLRMTRVNAETEYAVTSA